METERLTRARDLRVLRIINGVLFGRLHTRKQRVLPVCLYEGILGRNLGSCKRDHPILGY